MTNTRQRRRAWYGAGLIAISLAIAVLIFFLDDIIAAFRPVYEVVVVVERAPGLTTGSPVWIGGKEVGRVTSVGFLPSGPDTLSNVAITVELPRRLQHQVRVDSDVRLTKARLVSAPVVDVLPGSPAAPVLEPGDTLRVRQRLDVAQVTARAAAVRTSLDSAIQQLRLLGPPMRERMSAVQRAFASLEAAMDQARALQRGYSTGMGALLSDTAFAASLERTRGHAGELTRVVKSLPERASLDGDLSAAIARLRMRADSLTALLDATALAMEHGFFARSQRDSALARAITAARVELDSLIAETRRNPLRFFF